ncbi:MAG: hypothetical protein DRN04_17670 [Thermoprotei archaeon]|nr:MAG: hypothetical protein DRN04_17670 [Thermoprotei archaeon]
MSSAIENLVSLFEIYKNPLKILIILLSSTELQDTVQVFNKELVVTPQNVISINRLTKYLHKPKHLVSSTENKLTVHKNKFSRIKFKKPRLHLPNTSTSIVLTQITVTLLSQ